MASKKKSKLWIWITLVLVILAVGIPIYLKYKSKDGPIEVTLEKVERRTLTSTVTATGKIQPQVMVTISSEVSGEIIELPVREGQKVKRGDLLVRIKDDTYQAQVRQREASLSSSRATNLERKAELLKSEVDLKRIQEIFSQGFSTQSELDAAQTRYEVAKASYQASLYSIEQQEMLLQEARDELAKTVIYSPMDGTISKLSVELGERVVGTGLNPGTEMMDVADLTRMQARVDVSESDIINVKIDDTAEVEVDALGRRTRISGQVVEIGSSALVAMENTREQVTNFEVRIRLDNFDERIKPGMSATADISTETVENVLSVSLQAVTVRDRKELEEGEGKADPTLGEATKIQYQGRKGEPNREDNLQRVVFINNNGVAKIQAVETGVTDNTHIEIISGLDEGVEIVSGNYTALTRLLKNNSRIEEKKNPSKK